MTLAFLFPGQGAQTIGMGQALAEAYPAAKAVFDEVDDALGEKLSDLIWSGDQDDLTLTQNAQPALMATSMAAMRALEAEGVAITDAVAARCQYERRRGERDRIVTPRARDRKLQRIDGGVGVGVGVCGRHIDVRLEPRHR